MHNHNLQQVVVLSNILMSVGLRLGLVKQALQQSCTVPDSWQMPTSEASSTAACSSTSSDNVVLLKTVL